MAAETLNDQTDRQLVGQFLAQREEAVFEAILRRHGAMVYRVCWRVLRQAQDTEDAFQATFLLLAQKLRTVRNHDSLASWLHGVAHRVALQAKARAASRRRHERRATMPQVERPADLSAEELLVVLDAELAKLPDKWRLPLILCYLEGRTQEESARQLGWSMSTLRRRLEEARDALGRRLKGRGLVWSAAVSAVLLSDCVASASPPHGLVTSTIEAAASVAAGKTVAIVASARVAALMEGVTKAMFLSKLKAIIGVAVILGLIVTGATVLCRTTAAGTNPPPAAEAPVKPAAKPEQKQEKPAKEPFTAWGQEVGGLQAGLGFRPGEQRAYGLGETVTLVVRIRNVGKETVKFEYLEQYLDEEPPVVTGADGKTLPQHRTPLLGEHFPVCVSLEPGQQIELKSHMDGALAVRHHLMSVKPSEQKPAERRLGRRLFVAAGKITVHYDRVFGNTSAGNISLDPALSKLATGNLELEIKSDPPKARPATKPADQEKQSDDAKPPADDATKLLGDWDLVSFGEDGQVGAVPGWTMKIDKEQLTMSVDNELKMGAWKIDPRKTPKHIDMPNFLGSACIYKLDKDELTIACNRLSKTSERPKDFDSAQVTLVFRRKK
jgi:RNA polymerase sigma factor (sigma-70 family)